MQTNEQILLRFAEELRLRGLAPATQKQFLRFAHEFIEWANRNAGEMGEEYIQNYLDYLTNTRKLSDSTVRVRSTAIRLLFGTIFIDGGFSPKPRRKLIKNGRLKEAREGFIRYLHDMGYEKKSLKNYRWVIKCLDQFMHDQSRARYSRAVSEAFLKDAARSGRHTSGILEMMGYVLRRFDCFMENKDHILIMPRTSKESPPQFAEGFAGYLDQMRLRGLRESTIELHRYNIQKALLKFDAAAIQSFSEIEPKTIYDAFEKTSDKHGFCAPTRGLLRYLFKSGIIRFDYSEFVPSVRKAHNVPSVYTTAETEKLLDSIEGNASSAKRSNAIILLALRLGIRSGDIANMKFTDVDFVGKTISFIQEKTSVPQQLELLPDVERAMLSYIEERPDSSIPNVFLSVKAPIRAISTKTVYSLVSHRFEKSGIDTGERKRGGHALRMTLASELVAENVPYDAVRKILGQEDPNSTKHYVKYDIEALRSCSIEVSPATGSLAAYMDARIGGVS